MAERVPAGGPDDLNGKASAGPAGGAALGRDGAHQLRTSQRRVLQALTWADGLTRTSLAAHLGMPKATVTGLVDSLIGRGLVVERPALSRQGRAGRPAKVLFPAGPSPTTGAIVVSGGTLVAAVVTYAGAVLSRVSVPFLHPENNPGAMKLAIDMLREAIAAVDRLRPAGAGGAQTNGGGWDEPGRPGGGPTAVVLGIPAPFLAKLGVAPFSGPPELAGDPLSDVAGYMRWLNEGTMTQLAEAFSVPVVVENDANLGAVGEATFGAGKNIDSFVFLKLARGVGAGLIFGGRLHRGVTGFAGELAHVHVRDEGPLCPCGGRGCLRSILGDALVQSVQPAYDHPLTLRDVLDLAANGDPGPRRVLGDLGRTMGRPLADFATLLNPGAVIVDGSFAPAVDQVVAGVRESIDRYAAPAAAAAVKVVPGALGEDAELLGAAVLARARHAEAAAGGPRPRPAQMSPGDRPYAT